MRVNVPRLKPMTGIGLTIPGEKTGFYVVVHMEKYTQPGYRFRRMDIVKEGAILTPDKLMERVEFLSEKYECHQQVYGYMNTIDYGIAAQINRNVLSHFGRYLNIVQPEGEDGTIINGLSVIRERTRAMTKTLYFGSKSSLPGYLHEIPIDIKPNDYRMHPEISALAAVVSGLNLFDITETRLENSVNYGKRNNKRTRRTGV